MEYDQLKKIDTKEFELPETVFVRDIESRVFQSIALQSLAQIEGIGLIEGNLIDTLLGREVSEGVKGIEVEQDQKLHSVKVRVQVKIAYGMSIPQKAEEIQNRVAHDISRLTGLHVAQVHVVFKDLMTPPSSVENREKSPIAEEHHTESYSLF